MFALDSARRRRKPRYLNELRRHVAQISFQLSAARPNIAHDVVAAMLAVNEIDDAALTKLATRELYADAAAILVRAIRPRVRTELVGDLYAGPCSIFLPGRVASYMGVVSRPNRNKGSYVFPLITLDTIRSYAGKTEAARALRAKTALAILGEPVAPYCELSRRERAGLLLGLLVAAWRERSP